MSLRFLHTADWHLGQTFNGFAREAEHADFFQQLLTTLRERRPDALLVAGDIFDGVNPSAESQRLYYGFLAKASVECPGLQIVITAGNHDAAARLEAPAEVLQALRIAVVGTIERDDAGAICYEKCLIPLRDATGRVAALTLAVPFLRQADVPVVENAEDAYLDGIRAFYTELTAHARARRDAEFPGVPLIALGHLHMPEGAMSEGAERRIVIGGSEAVRDDTFPPDLAYVALGHLHKPQELAGGRIRYCGSPFPLSFTEIAYRHRVVEVTVGPAGLLATADLPLARPVELLRIPATGALPLDEALAALAAHPVDASLPLERQPFLEVRVRDEGPDPTRAPRIRAALENKPVRLTGIVPVRPAEAQAPAPEAATAPALNLADLTSLDPEKILLGAYREEYAAEPAADILACLREILAAEGTEAAAPRA